MLQRPNETKAKLETAVARSWQTRQGNLEQRRLLHRWLLRHARWQQSANNTCGNKRLVQRLDATAQRHRERGAMHMLGLRRATEAQSPEMPSSVPHAFSACVLPRSNCAASSCAVHVSVRLLEYRTWSLAWLCVIRPSAVVFPLLSQSGDACDARWSPRHDPCWTHQSPSKRTCEMCLAVVCALQCP